MLPIFLTRLIIHGGYQLHTAPSLPLQRPLRPQGLSLGTFNIHNGWGSRLIAQAIRVVQIGGFELMILKEVQPDRLGFWRVLILR